MSRGWNYVSGDWNVVCDSCSLKTKASKTKERWDGFRVCPDCWEPRQSLDFIRAKPDKIRVPFTRPQPDDSFVDVGYSTVYIADGYFMDVPPSTYYIETT